MFGRDGVFNWNWWEEVRKPLEMQFLAEDGGMEASLWASGWLCLRQSSGCVSSGPGFRDIPEASVFPAG